MNPKRLLLGFVLAPLFCASAAQAQQGPTPQVNYPLGGVYFHDAKVSAIQSSPACPNDLCPGFGNGFYLPIVNARSINTGGAIFFKDRNLGPSGSCAVLSNVSQNTRQFLAADSMEKLVTQSMLEADISGSYKTGVLTVKGSVQATTGHSSEVTTTFNTTHMDVDVVTHVVDFQQNTRCWSEQNLDPAFLTRFGSLALIDPASVGEASSWSPYVQFLTSQGSHIMMQQQIGSRFQQWESASSEERDIASTLEIKACAEVEGTKPGGGWSVNACGKYGTEEKQQALRKRTETRRFILGGTEKTRAALTKEVNAQNLNDFIDSAANGNQAVRFIFKPIWELLYGIYEPACAQAGAGSGPCGNLQRAVNLQAAYEGWTAVGCPLTKDGRDVVYQTMKIAGTTSLGINTYQCRLAKTGCRKDPDCNVPFPGLDAFCHGQGCIDQGDAISGTPMFRNKVRGSQSGKNNEGVNLSCYWHPFEARCKTDWVGGLPERDIYLQSAPTVTMLKAGAQ